MRLTKYWSISIEYLDQLQKMSKSKLMKFIEGKQLFSGMSDLYAKAENKKIYERINSREAKRLTKGIKSIEDSKRNG